MSDRVLFSDLSGGPFMAPNWVLPNNSGDRDAPKEAGSPQGDRILRGSDAELLEADLCSRWFQSTLHLWKSQEDPRATG